MNFGIKLGTFRNRLRPEIEASLSGLTQTRASWKGDTRSEKARRNPRQGLALRPAVWTAVDEEGMQITTTKFAVALNVPNRAAAPQAVRRRRQGLPTEARQVSCLQRTTQACKSHKLVIQAATEEIVEVKNLKGIRMKPRSPEDEEKKARPMVEYLVEWKDGSPDTWEPVTNLADNLLRDFESKWWTAVKRGDEAVMNEMLDGGGAVLSRTLNEDRRSALHYAAALGKADLVRRLIRDGAEVDLGDRDGYTPLHMAAGYLHTSTIYALIEGNADPEQQDLQGRSPLELVESLRAALPPDNPATAARRIALEEVLKVLVDNLFEDVLPDAVLDCSEIEDGDGAKEYLVKFPDEEEAIWVHEKYMSEEVVSDYEENLEYATAKEIVNVRNKGDSRAYLVRWMDGSEDSWEPEEHVSQDLIFMFENDGALPPGVKL